MKNVLMAKGYRLVDRDQQFLMAPDMREWLPVDHSVWALIGIVEDLDTSAFHRLRRTGGVGRAGYHPDMLVTLLIWAWSQGVRSSRRIEAACADVVSYRVICAGDAPDHVTIARFRADNHGACEQLFGQVLMLAARLGLGRLETVALDGVKIASNASMAANRRSSGVAKAAAAEAARIAKKAAAEHAATDAAEDELYGQDNPGSVPAELTDPAVLAKRVKEEIARLKAETADDRAERDDPPLASPSAESSGLQPIAHDRAGRIAQAQACLDAAVAEAAQAAERDSHRVAGAERALAATIARSQAAHDRWTSRGVVGTRRAGRAPVPVERNARVRQARVRLQRAQEKAAARIEAAQTVERTVNLTDPQSRMQPLRGGGWVQGYNCQAVTTEDGLIVATDVGTSPVDNQYYRDMIDKAVTAAEVITNHRPPDADDEAATSSIGMVLADAGYCTKDNLNASGPDRLIATGKARDMHHAATEEPTEGPPPEHLGPIEAMAHRLRTPEGITRYAKRSHIAETPFGHAKHNLGFRRFTSRGLARARNEWTFHAAVHNIGKILTHLAAPPLPA